MGHTGPWALPAPHCAHPDRHPLRTMERRGAAYSGDTHSPGSLLVSSSPAPDPAGLEVYALLQQLRPAWCHLISGLSRASSSTSQLSPPTCPPPRRDNQLPGLRNILAWHSYTLTRRLVAFQSITSLLSPLCLVLVTVFGGPGLGPHVTSGAQPPYPPPGLFHFRQSHQDARKGVASGQRTRVESQEAGAKPRGATEKEGALPGGYSPRDLFFCFLCQKHYTLTSSSELTGHIPAWHPNALRGCRWARPEQEVMDTR